MGLFIVEWSNCLLGGLDMLCDEFRFLLVVNPWNLMLSDEDVMKPSLLISFVLVMQFGVCGSAHADLSVARIFSDHMVLQQGVVNPIWGWADPGSEVSIMLSGQPAIMCTSNADGRWHASLPEMAASSRPTKIVIESQEDRITLDDVLVGEVWFCSGQSNMQWRVHSCDRYQEFLTDAERPTIRMFTVQLTSVNAPAEDLMGEWVVCSPESVGDFSATAYHMGRTLSDQLGVPIGLVNSSWGGSSVEAWIDPERLSWVSPGRRVQAQFQALEQERQMDRDQFVRIHMDDSGWLEGSIPGHTRAFGVDDQVDGVFWFRIPFDIPKHWSGRTLRLSLGMIDDDDVTYFNGSEIGRTRGWQQPRRYEVPADLVSPGPAMIAVRVTDGAGPGGLHGDGQSLFVHPLDDSEDRIMLAGDAKMKVAAEVQNLADQHKPSHLYHGMFHPVRDVPFAGVAWYQGENNALGGRADEYHLLLPLLIQSWRDALADADLPFLIVQLPNWDHGEGTWDYPRLREAQRLTHESVPNTGLIITTDIGDSGDIHPGNKHDVGDRLGRWALVDVYEVEGVEKGGPLPRRAIWSTDRIQIEFNTFGSSLARRGSKSTSTGGSEPVSGFQIRGPEGDMIPIAARITSNDVVTIDLPLDCRETTLLRYSWAPDPTEADLVNAIGMPASPFEYHRP